MAHHEYIRRHIDTAIDQLFLELPAIMLTGPRGCGKTTTAAARCISQLRLDRREQAAALAASPDAVLAAQRPPVLVDEWQIVPESLGAVKRSVDGDARPGHYLLTGSVRARTSPAGWPATGRIVPLAMYGLTAAELEGSAASEHILDLLFGDQDPTIGSRTAAPTVVDYLDAAIAGGFPQAIGLTDFARSTWYDGYVEQLVHHDVSELASVRSPGGLARLIKAVALNSAGLPSLKTMADAAQLDHRTTQTYLDLLEDLRMIERVPAWTSNRFTRLVKTPKYYILDPGMAAHLCGDNRNGLLTNADRIGRIIDTFTMAQIRPLLKLASPAVSAFHLRDTNGDHEIDLILESAAGQIVAIEIKAAETVTPRAARHMEWLRDHIGDTFVRGIVLHTGSMAFPLGDRVWAMPICSLWRGW